MTFEVTDGTRPDDGQGLTAILTIPIDVAGRGNTLPTFQPSQVSVAAGEPATTVDLRTMVTDPDPGDLGAHDVLPGDPTAGVRDRVVRFAAERQGAG